MSQDMRQGNEFLDGNKSPVTPINFTIFIKKQLKNTQIFSQKFGLVFVQICKLQRIFRFGPWPLSLLYDRTQFSCDFEII